MFKVEIQYKGSPSFSQDDIAAESESAAIEVAKRNAAACGFNSPIKKVTAKKK